MNKAEYDAHIDRLNRRLLEVLAPDDVLEGSLRWAFDGADMEDRDVFRFVDGVSR